MISPGEQRAKHLSNNSPGTNGAMPFYKLTATMVELSLRRRLPDLNIEVSIKPDSHSPEVKSQVISINTSGATKQEGRKADLSRESMAVASKQELWRTYISRINDQSVKILLRLRTRSGFLAFALLALPSVYVFLHKSESQPQKPAMVQQQLPPAVPSIPPQNVDNHAREVITKKAKPRRQRSDYVAKDTYVYYGTGGKPSK